MHTDRMVESQQKEAITMMKKIPEKVLVIDENSNTNIENNLQIGIDRNHK